MDYRSLGRTGLRVSVAGLGCGGFSRLGLGRGRSEDEAVAVVHAALDHGVTFIDTAAAYGTEEVVGRALAGRREGVVLATKSMTREGGRALSGAEVVASLEESLRKLRTDRVEVFQLHAVLPREYGHVMAEIVPALLRAKEAGKIRHIGITETAPNDHGHETLARSLDDDVWETMMVAFNMMHTNAREVLFPRTMAQGVGTLLMFVVRNVFSQPERLAAEMRGLAEAGKLPAEVAADPLGFLLHPAGARSLTDAAYRFVRHEPGVDVVLFGTSDVGHLRENIASILAPKLPEADLALLRARFGHLVGVGLDGPKVD
jgi:aryl-alcohol dehydrogenase-like predicted oxidoreductase